MSNDYELLERDSPATTDPVNGIAFDGFEAVVEVVVEMARLEKIRIDATNNARMAAEARIDLGGEARGLLRAAGWTKGLQAAIAENWHGLADKLQGRI